MGTMMVEDTNDEALDLSESERLDLAKVVHALHGMSPQELSEFMKGTPDE